MPSKGKYRYQVVEHIGTEYEYVSSQFEIKKRAQEFIHELYEPADLAEMNVQIRRVNKPGPKPEHFPIPEDTHIEHEVIKTGGRPYHRYVAVSGDCRRSFNGRRAAADWLNRNCRPMPMITTETMADVMRRGIETASDKWLDGIDPVEVVSSGSPWYGDASVYANPFAIRVAMTGKRPFILTRGDLVDGMAAALVDDEMRKTVENFISGKYSNADAERFLKFILSQKH